MDDLNLMEPSPSLVSNLVADILSMRKERDALRKQLRYHVLHQRTPLRSRCGACESEWPSAGPELHAAGCLAALPVQKRDAAMNSPEPKDE